MNDKSQKHLFGEKRLYVQYKYGSHCYIITLILLLIGCLLKFFGGFGFENELDFLLLVLGVSGSYYILRLVTCGAFLPEKLRGKERSIILVMIVLNVMVLIRWHSVENNIKLIIANRIMYSDFVENFTLQIVVLVMLVSFVIRKLYEEKKEKSFLIK